MTSFVFNKALRHQKSKAYDLIANSTAKRVVTFNLWDQDVNIYANANLSIYSAQSCNAKCGFCVEELRPASRGIELNRQKTIEERNDVYFERLRETLRSLEPLNPSVSITGGEASKDPRLPRLLRLFSGKPARKLVMTTNGSGLFDIREGQPLIDWLIHGNVHHINISRAHPDPEWNARLMALPDGLSLDSLKNLVQYSRNHGMRLRLSCVLLKGVIDDLASIIHYLDFARSLGVDNVIFRQLMKTSPSTHVKNHVINYSDNKRVLLEPILNQLDDHSYFQFQNQIVGYYYYVEVWRYKDVDVVFEEADLAQLEITKITMPNIIHELVFHPNASLCSTWQPWDGILGPREKVLI